MNKTSERLTARTRTPSRVIDISVVIPPIEEGRTGVLTQGNVYSMDLAEVQSDGGPEEEGSLAQSAHGVRKELECTWSRNTLYI